MVRQNIPLRGHIPEESNFNALIAIVAQHNSSLRNHLDSPRSNAKCTSPQIQNELLDIAAQQILSRIVADCRKTGCSAFMADESDRRRSEGTNISVCAFCGRGEEWKALCT